MRAALFRFLTNTNITVEKKNKTWACREFSIFESAPEQYKKAVFVISSPVCGSTEETLKAIISASSFHYCVVISTCHPAVTRCSDNDEKSVILSFLPSFANNPTRDWNLEDQSSIQRWGNSKLNTKVGKFKFWGQTIDFLMTQCEYEGKKGNKWPVPNHLLWKRKPHQKSLVTTK